MISTAYFPPPPSPPPPSPRLISSSELDCGHRFCKSCVELYLSLTISANPNLVHKRSFSRRDDEISVSIRQLDLVGVRCPHFNCLGVIGEAKIKDLADKRTYDKFDQFALDQVRSLAVDSSHSHLISPHFTSPSSFLVISSYFHFVRL